MILMLQSFIDMIRNKYTIVNYDVFTIIIMNDK